MTKLNNLSKEILSYLAGFIDGDGSINAQIVRRLDYRLGFQIRVSITFFQSSKRHWFLIKLQDFIKYGTLRLRSDGISELTLVGVQTVEPFLKAIQPYIILKQRQTAIVLEVSNKLSKNQSPEDFIELCKKVDQLESLNDSKKRSIRAVDVEKYLAGQKN